MRLYRSRRHLHWWTAALLLTGFVIAWIMTNLPLAMLLAKFLLYQAHKNIGLVVFALAAIRLCLAYAVRDPPSGTTALLYGLLLIVPILGYLTAASAPTRVPTLFLLLWSVPHAIGADEATFGIARFAHRWLAIGLIVLGGWHAARMLRPRQAAPGHGS